MIRLEWGDSSDRNQPDNCSMTGIRIRDLSKCYKVHHNAPRGTYGYRTLRDDLTRLAKAPLQWVRGRGAGGGDG